MASLGQRIRERRKELNLTQAELAEPEFSKSYISYIERDKREPSAEALEILARKLQVPLSFFLHEQAADTENRFNTLVNNAIAYIAAMDLESAKSLLDDAWAFHDQVSQPQSLARYYEALARWHQQNGEYYLALHQLLQGAKAVASDPEAVGFFHYQTGRILQKLNQLQDAQHYYEQALLHCANSDANAERLSYIYCALASILLEQGDLAGALKMYDAGAKLKSCPRTKLISLIGLSRTYTQTGQAQLALDASRQARALADKLQDKTLAAQTHLLLGSLLTEKGEFQRANEALNQACATAVELADKDLYCQIQLVQAKLLAKQGDRPAAIDLIRQLSNTLSRENDMTLYKYKIESHMALCKLVLPADPAAALEQARTAAQLAHNCKHQSALIKALTLESNILQQLGQLEEALATALEALRLQQNI